MMVLHTPTPASAVAPTPAMWPMNTRSTRPYSMFIVCAATAGAAIFSSSGSILPVANSLSPDANRYTAIQPR